jgi:hypothetical protein
LSSSPRTGKKKNCNITIIFRITRRAQSMGTEKGGTWKGTTLPPIIAYTLSSTKSEIRAK